MALVLIVEDTQDNRVIYRTILEYAGHTVIEAENGADALPLVRERRPDLIVMDVTMPVMDGLKATRHLKGNPDTNSIPILVFTANASARDREDAVQAGANAYLAKPCSPKTMLAEVERLLFAAGAASS